MTGRPVNRLGLPLLRTPQMTTYPAVLGVGKEFHGTTHCRID